ncbi:hypothetical protein SAMN05443667_11247 [Flavobacterium gillisiae]|uniref:Uncharacterized protein n=1 Tax=Flavobacterium gillisiae TaxID=150146 RepID=A0A1H4F8U7_9FLAO|nr:hypothetical protein SAMN05443667_11247 [Flavobacterium gillisiae]
MFYSCFFLTIEIANIMELFYEGKRRSYLIRMNKYVVLVNAYHLRVGATAPIKISQNK